MLLAMPGQLAAAVIPHIHDPANLVSGNGEFIREMEGRLSGLKQKTGIRMLVRYHAKEPPEELDNEPGKFMRALSSQLGVSDNGVLAVHFADGDEWRVWIGNELTSRFVGKEGTVAEFTASGAMHEAKEAWLEKVFAKSEGVWTWWQSTSKGKAKPSEKVEFETIALSDGVEEKFAADRVVTAEAEGKYICSYVPPNTPEMRALIKSRLEARDEKGRTPLMIATHTNDITESKWMIRAGANVNARDNLKDTPFLYAAAEGRTEILKLTLAHGADLSSLNRYEGTALIPAAEKGHLENVRVLLQTEIDIDHVNRSRLDRAL